MYATVVMKWLKNNKRIPNLKKIQLIFLARKNSEREMYFGGKTIALLKTVELLGVTVNFKSLVEYICCKANKKI